MTKRFWLSWVLPAVVLAGAGCAVPCHKGYQKALEHGTDCPLPPACRNRVHVFLMHGLTPSTKGGLEALRLRLGECGFAKVGSGELCHAWWVKDEIECIVRHDPGARVVLVGYDYGAATAVPLARDLKAKGVAVDAVVLLNPKGCGADPSGVHTLLVTDGKCTPRVPHTARVVVPDATHLTLPAHPATVAALTDLLSNIAAANCEPPFEEIPHWTYPHAPEVIPVPTREVSAEWNFLADTGPPRALGASPVVAPAAPGRPAVAGAGPVVPAGGKR